MELVSVQGLKVVILLPKITRATILAIPRVAKFFDIV
jgi:hypothetical protein